MFNDIIGITSYLIVILIYLILAKLRPNIATIIYVALVIRIVFILIHHNVTPLPDSHGDARNFEITAYKWSKDGFLNTIYNYPGVSSYFISWFISILYSIFGHSELMAHSLSLFFGMGSIFLGYSIAAKLWDLKTANKAGWFMALFPALILYSCLILREVYVCFFLLLAIYGCIGWMWNKSFKYFILIIVGFVIATYFHGPLFIGLLTFLTIVFLKNIKETFINLKKLKIKYKNIFVVFTILIFASIFIAKDVSIPKLGQLSKFTVSGEHSVILKILEKNRDFDRGTAKYPSWLVATSGVEIVYKSPFRIIYFLFAPFPWDVTKFSHLMGLFDGILYMFLTYFIFCNRKNIFADPVLKLILFILLSYILLYGISVGNFGTGLRHRVKFVPIFILLAAPYLPKFNFSKKIIK